jgi:hypothetical protein
MLATTNSVLRVHPAQPRYFVVVSRRSSNGESINCAADTQMGMHEAFRKGMADCNCS